MRQSFRSAGHPGSERGAVTVEAAISVCALVVMLGLVLAGVGAVIDQLRCTDAAREAARLVARGESHRAPQAVQRIGPRGARLEVSGDGAEISVQVSVRAASGLLPGVHLSASAYAVAEPGVDRQRAGERGAR